MVNCFLGFLRGGGNWGTLRIPREDWGTLGNIRNDYVGESPPPLKNPIIVGLRPDGLDSWDLPIRKGLLLKGTLSNPKPAGPKPTSKHLDAPGS